MDTQGLHVALQAVRKLQLGVLIDHCASFFKAVGCVFGRVELSRVTEGWSPNEIREGVCLRDRYAQSFAGRLDSHFATVAREVANVSHVSLSVFPTCELKDLVTTVVWVIGVNIRFVFAARVSEALKDH